MMHIIDRKVLEKPTPLRQAIIILNDFLENYETYPIEDFLKRKGICKVLAEEYLPLVSLAQGLENVKSINLTTYSNNGPDAEISFLDRKIATVQITCAHEGKGHALFREKILLKGSAITDLITVEERIARILNAILRKEGMNYNNTEILLIHDDPAEIDYYKEGHLHEKICRKVDTMKSQFKHIYVNYGNNLKLVK